jgi:hypothetical protein
MYPATGANAVGQMVFMMRSTGDPASLPPAVRRVVSDVDADWSAASVATQEQRPDILAFAITAFALTGHHAAAAIDLRRMAYLVSSAHARDAAFASRSGRHTR